VHVSCPCTWILLLGSVNVLKVSHKTKRQSEMVAWAGKVLQRARGAGVDYQGCDWIAVSCCARGVACGDAYAARERRPAGVRGPYCTHSTQGACWSSTSPW